MDRECIRENKAAFEAWLDGKEIERLKTAGWLPEPNPYFTGNQQYRVKPEVVQPCKYPGLRKAIQERKKLKIRVNPEQSKDVQEIAAECRVYWRGQSSVFVNYTDSQFLFLDDENGRIFSLSRDTDTDNGKFFKRHPNPEFYLATDSFNPPLPEWIKHGQKAFYGEKLVTIEKYNPDLQLPIYVSSDKGNHQAWTAVSELTPAVLREPTFDELAARMPFAVKWKRNQDIYTALGTMGNKIGVLGINYYDINKFCNEFTEIDGSEIGIWVKA